MHTSGRTAEPRDRAVAPGGPRDRRLAPVYALVVSFLAVVLLGAVVREPAGQPVDPRPVDPRSVDLQLVTTGRAPVTDLANAQVKLLDGSGTTLVVNAEGRVDDVKSGESLTVCVRLPRGWTAPKPAEQLADFACWPSVDPDVVNADGRVELVVTWSEVGR
ncbi:hypothetical protein AB0K14_35770 [Actinosynnema sp. NPDC050801]|uniref:hypothetical protein n=1 Tax=unclassified Actinosynnema TaxID=2637065 RepID=UPI0033C9DED6